VPLLLLEGALLCQLFGTREERDGCGCAGHDAPFKSS
jgi:hypothetical protein